MSEYSKNIIFDKSDLESDFHKKQIEIASLNLDDFNKRFKSNIIIKYDSNHNLFFLISNYEKYGSVFLRSLSHKLSFFNNQNWSEGEFISDDLSRISYVYKGLFYSIKDNNYKFTKADDSELHLFITRFDSYFPLGIISGKGQQHYKETVQRMVDELKSIKYLIS